MENDGLLNKINNFFLKDSRTNLYLLLIILLGLMLRIIAANNLMLGADDSHFATHSINFINSGKLETWDQSASLWYIFTDIAYKIMGTTQIASRMASIIFGTLSIFLIFFLTKEFFGRKTSLIAAFLLAVSPWLIKNTLAEMDVMAMFFVLFSALLFYRGLKNKSMVFIVFSGILMGLAFMTKAYTPLFALSLVLFSVFYAYKNKVSKKEIVKIILIFSVVAAIFALPMVVSNYLLYKDHGFTDYLTSKTLDIGKNKSSEFYGWDAGWNRKSDWGGFFLGGSENTHVSYPTALLTLQYFLYGDPLVFLLTFIGIFMLIRKRDWKYLAFFIFMFALAWIYIGSNQLLAKHFLFETIFAMPIAAYSLSRIMDNIRRIRLRHILVMGLIFNLIFLGIQIGGSYYTYYHFYSESPQQQLMKFKQSSIPPEALVILDERIYRGQDAWIFNDRYYLEAPIFLQYAALPDSATNAVDVNAYFIECGIDVCGWGVNPELNKSMESLIDSIQKSGDLVEIIESKKIGETYIPFIKNPSDENYFKVYRLNLKINPQVFSIAKSNKIWFSYPIGYDKSISPIFDDYITHNFGSRWLDRIAHGILKLGLLLGLLSIIYIIYMYLREG